MFLNELGVELACAVNTDRKAVIDASHRVFVNYETFYFSDDDAQEAFRRAPHRYSGLLTDPVTRKRFAPGSDSPRRETGGRVLYFASAETAAQFDSDPDEFGAMDLSM